jgi:hypothetical protein
VGLKLNGTHQRLVYADDENLLEDNIVTIKKNTETLLDASNDVGLEVNAEKNKYLLMSDHQNSGQNHNIKITNGSFANVAQVQIFVNESNDQNLVQREIIGSLNFGNA